MKTWIWTGAVLLVAAAVWLWLYQRISEENAEADARAHAAVIVANSAPADNSAIPPTAPTTPPAAPVAIVSPDASPPPPAVSHPAASTNAVTPTMAASIPPRAAAPAKATPAAALTKVPAGQTIVYQDKFGRTGDLNGSAPDVKNTNSAKWTVSTGPGAYFTKQGAVSDKNAAFDAACLPVNNGASGVTLDGKKSFTLSAIITPDSTNNWMGIALNAAPITAGHNIFDAGVVEMTLGRTAARAYSQQIGLNDATMSYAATGPTAVSISYHASKSTITCSVAGNIVATLPGITPDKISGLTDVSFGNGGAGPTSALANFTLAVGGTE
jgi:hypothetical protein